MFCFGVFNKLIRFLFLIKEIISKEGKIHFRRYRLFACPWLRVYLHQILVSDYDHHFHDHPWPFRSFILKGSYREWNTYHPSHYATHSRVYKAGQSVKHHARDTHKIELLTPEVWTLVIAWGKYQEWGYRLNPNTWVDHKMYRKLKNEGKL